MLNDNSLIFLAPDQVSCDLDNEATILNLKTGIYFGLNEVGAHVWRLLEKPRSLAELRAAVTAEYEVEPEQCERDLRALLVELVDHQLVEIRNAAGE